MAPALKPFQLLEISIMSAQDLEPVSKKMKTYSTAWVHSKRKLSTHIDNKGNNNPTWNDKFVFRLDEDFLRDDTSAVMIEIYSTHWFRDTLVGTVRALVGNLVTPPRPFHNTYYNGGMRCVALQVRRPSGRPQGILNIGVAVLDSSMRSMPLYRQPSASAVGYCDLMGMKDDESHYDPNYHHQTLQIHQNQNATNEPPVVRPILCRSRSEKSAMFDSSSVANSSMVAFPQKMGKPGSMLSGSEHGGSSRVDSRRWKASSVINGAELQEKSKPKGKKRKASSLISGSIFSKDSRTDETKENKPANQKNAAAGGSAPVPVPVIGKPISRPIGYEGGQKVCVFGNGKYQLRAPPKPNSILSGSEVGPSPSEVAAMMERRYPLADDRSSSVLDGWSLDESAEGLRSKLERWRTELPPLYDTGFSTSTFRTNSRRKRGHTDGGDIGLLSCFGNICGYECQCVCGKPPSAKSRGSRLSSPSIGSTRRSF